jgi:hypothetical protein
MGKRSALQKQDGPPRRRKRNPVTMMVNMRGPVSDRTQVVFKYSSIHALTYGGLGAAAVYQFRANSIFDPDLTGVGHQPLASDEWGAFYNKYRVLKVHYTFIVSNQGNYQMETTVLQRPNVATTTLMDTLVESEGNLGYHLLDHEGSGQGVHTFRGTMVMSQVRGVPPNAVELENDYAALFGNNPSVVCTLNLAVANLSASTAASVSFRAILEYETILYDRKVLSQS